MRSIDMFFFFLEATAAAAAASLAVNVDVDNSIDSFPLAPTPHAPRLPRTRSRPRRLLLLPKGHRLHRSTDPRPRRCLRGRCRRSRRRRCHHGRGVDAWSSLDGRCFFFLLCFFPFRVPKGPRCVTREARFVLLLFSLCRVQEVKEEKGKEKRRRRNERNDENKIDYDKKTTPVKKKLIIIFFHLKTRPPPAPAPGACP